jgi:hypothetical protein
MEDSDFSQEFFGFIRAAIPSVSAAELLLLLFNHPVRWWTLPELLRELPADVRISEADAGACVETLRSYGLIEFDAEKRLRYRAQSETLDRQVRTLAEAYNQRPVTLIRMIYALRDSTIQSFADAFKFRKR